jgi:hypothetical protein
LAVRSGRSRCRSHGDLAPGTAVARARHSRSRPHVLRGRRSGAHARRAPRAGAVTSAGQSARVLARASFERRQFAQAATVTRSARCVRKRRAGRAPDRGQPSATLLPRSAARRRAARRWAPRALR